MVAGAKTVDTTVAREAAALFIHREAKSLHLQQLPFATMYLFSVDGGGFVLTSADDRVECVLGYSLEEAVTARTSDNPLFYAWLEHYDAQIQAAMKDGSLDTHPDWCEMTVGRVPKGVYNTAVSPMLTTRWDQEPRYNAQCPSGTVTGCVATAMGQIMKYWNWPESGVGSHSYTQEGSSNPQSADFGATTYDWAHMPNVLTAASSNEEIQAVSTLLYHCGVAVDMYYSFSSGAWTTSMNHGLDYPCAENAYIKYFKYSPAISGSFRNGFSDAEWRDLIKNELDNGRPVHYGSGDHSYVCDGYDTNARFHMNWGWGGQYDGYFSLSNLTPGNINLGYEQSVITGIEPDTLYGSSNQCTVTLTCDAEIGSVSGSGTYTYRDTVVATASPHSGYRFLRWGNGATTNPYAFLAHDVNLEAIYAWGLHENNDTLSYTGAELDNYGLFMFKTGEAVATRYPAGLLQGHHCLTDVDLHLREGNYVMSIWRGGDNAPGRKVYSQPVRSNDANNRWMRIPLEMPVAIDQDSNMWITLQMFQQSWLCGGIDLYVPDANWISIDDGASWQILNESDIERTMCENRMSWFMRCITSADSCQMPDNNGQIPAALLWGPNHGDIGDTLVFIIYHSNASTAQWLPGDEDVAWSQADSDTLRLVFSQTGDHTVSAVVSMADTSITLEYTVTLNDCGTPVSAFPYTVDFSQEEELPQCWQVILNNDFAGYYISIHNYIEVMASGSDDMWITPLIDAGGNDSCWLQFRYKADDKVLVTVGVSHGGIDTSDFAVAYTCVPTTGWTLSEPINISRYRDIDGDISSILRAAFRIRLNPQYTSGFFSMDDISITKEPLGITTNDNADIYSRITIYLDGLDIKVSNPDAETFSLYDIMGRRLATTAVSAFSYRFPEAGVYLLQTPGHPARRIIAINNQ